MKHFIIAALILTGVGFACSSSGPAGGTVQGPLDTHCTLPDGGVQAQLTEPAACHPDGGTALPVDYGPTLYNAEADDDDCKYHVRFSSTPIYERQDVTFTMIATHKTDGTPAIGARIVLEIFLSDTHPAPNSNQTTLEGPAGTYKVGPVRFDAPGRWTVRFHLDEDCADLLRSSPHGHVAFYIDVP